MIYFALIVALLCMFGTGLICFFKIESINYRGAAVGLIMIAFLFLTVGYARVCLDNALSLRGDGSMQVLRGEKV